MVDGKKEEREKNNQPDLKAKLLLVLILIGVLALGLLALNQFLAFRFKAEFLGSPCDLCVELNPHLNRCFDDASNVVINKTTGEIVEDPYKINISNFINP